MAASNPEPKAGDKKAGGAAAKPSPAAQVAPSKRATEDKVADVERSAQDIVLENLPTIAVVLLIAMGLTALAVHRGNQQREVSEAAWTALGEAKSDTDSTPEDFARIYKEHTDTSAAPYIQLAWASRLYETGEKEKVEQALGIYQRVAEGYPEIPLIQRVVPAQIEKIEAELSDPSVPWAAAARAAREPEDGAAPAGDAGEETPADAAPADGSAEETADDAADDSAEAAPEGDASGAGEGEPAPAGDVGEGGE